MTVHTLFKTILVFATFLIGKSVHSSVCPYGWQWEPRSGLCNVTCTGHSKSSVTNINCQLPPFTTDVIYDSKNSVYSIKPGKSLNISSNNAVNNCYQVPSNDLNISFNGQLSSKSDQSPNISAHTYCYPLSPQLQQCKIKATNSGSYFIINGSVLVIPDDNFTAYLGDFFIDDSGVAYTCVQDISSSFYSYNQPRCHYISLDSREYVITDSGSMFIPKANFTIQNSNYSFIMDNITHVCIPTSIPFLNCPIRIAWEQYYYTIDSDLVAQVDFLNRKYSLDNYYIDKDDMLIVCLDEEDTYVSPTITNIYYVCLGFDIASTVCLILTLIFKFKFYLSNYHTKSLLFHIVCLICMYICTVIKRFVVAYNVFTCYLMFVCLYYSYMGAFFWLNVIAYDSLMTFGKLQTSPYHCQSLAICLKIFSNRKQFLFYNIYAWGMAFLLTVITLAVDLSPMPRDVMALNPQINAFCWFNNQDSQALFYYGPLGFLMFLNLIFFILTLYIIHYAGKGTDIVNNRRRNQTLKVAIKLFIVMGLVWTVDVICFSLNAYDKQNFKTWFISTLLTSVQGIVIFVVYFVSKKCLASCFNICCVKCGIKIAESKDDTIPLHADSIKSDLTVCTNLSINSNSSM